MSFYLCSVLVLECFAFVLECLWQFAFQDKEKAAIEA